MSRDSRKITTPVSTADGSKPPLPGTASRVFAGLAQRIGLDGIGLHTLRHTHASLTLAQGVHPKIVQERLSHSTIAVTLDTYAHVTPGLQEAAALRFEEGLGKAAATSLEREPARFAG